MNEKTINVMKLANDVNLNKNYHSDATKCHAAEWKLTTEGKINHSTINKK
jgi:hypothetical protein